MKKKIIFSALFVFFLMISTAFSATSIWRVNNSTSLGGEVCAPWTTGHAYALGARVVCRVAYATTARRAYVYECTTAGTSHGSTEPTWPTSGTVADNDVVWTTRSPDDGTWDNASCILHYVLNHAAVAAGDSVYIDDGHNENAIYTNNQYVVKGSTTLNAPVKIYCVDKTADTLSTGAYVYSGHSAALLFRGAVYSYGIKYGALYGITIGTTDLGYTILEGSGTTTLLVIASGRTLTWIANTTEEKLTIINGSIEFAAVNAYIFPTNYGSLLWEGGSVISTGGVGVTKLFDGTSSTYHRHAVIKNVDLSGVGNGAVATSLVDVADGVFENITFERCKLPTDAGFTLTVGAWQGPSGRVRLHHCSSDNKTYDFYEESYEGSVQDETTIVRTGGATDGTTPQSWKMVSSANTVDRINALCSPPITTWTSSTTSKVFTLEIVYDSLTNLQNDEVWAELEAPADNTSGLGQFVTSRAAPLATPADLSASTATWTTTGLTNPNTDKLQVTATPGKAGPVTMRACVAKASTTIYADPLITETTP